MKYDFTAIEKKWQKKWLEETCFGCLKKLKGWQKFSNKKVIICNSFVKINDIGQFKLQINLDFSFFCVGWKSCRRGIFAALWSYIAVVGDNPLCINDLSICLWGIFSIDNHLTRYVSGIYPPRLHRGATVRAFLQLMIDLFVILFNHFPQLIKSSGCKSLDIDCPFILEIESYCSCTPRTAKPHPYGTRFFKFVSV